MSDSQIYTVVSSYLDVEQKGDIYKTLCPFHHEKTPSFTLYPNSESCYCFGCGWSGDAIQFVREYDDKTFIEAKKVVEDMVGTVLPNNKEKENKKDDASPMPVEAIKEFQKDKVFQDLNYRGIRKETDEFFRVLSKVEDGQVKAQYYPETRGGKLYGYKCRNHPKDFSHGKIGATGVKSDLAGQFRFNNGGKYVLIVAGEIDLLSAYQMLRDHQIERNQGDFNPIPVVSPTSGENSAAKQCAAQYDWFDKFDNIIIGMDNDEVGIKAAKKIAGVLPKEKVKIATWSLKDPNEMLMKGMQKQFVRDFYNSKPYIKSSVLTSIDADGFIEEELGRKKVPLPPFMSQLQDMMAGGIPLGYIVNFIALTGIGKTSVVNEMIYYWIYNSPHKIGILSLELNAGQYMLAMLSREIGKKISLISDPDKAIEFINTDEVKRARERLRENEYGEERFVLLDEREGTLENTKHQCELLFNKYDCKVLIIDPLQDLIEASSQEDQIAFIKWMKNKIKSGYSFIPVCHVRKSSSSQGKDGKRVKRQLTEDDVHGISTIVKSAGANIFLTRDKYEEDEVERNTTYVEMGKCRWTGLTGPAGEWYYDNRTHTMYDKESYFGQESEDVENF